MKIFIRDVSLNKKVPVKFWKSIESALAELCGPRVFLLFCSLYSFVVFLVLHLLHQWMLIKIM